jgi:hypothetical protein
LIVKASGSEQAMDEMFAYLCSYTGLQMLEIPNLRMDSQAVEDLAAQRFWQEVIPHHQVAG